MKNILLIGLILFSFQPARAETKFSHIEETALKCFVERYLERALSRINGLAPNKTIKIYRVDGLMSGTFQYKIKTVKPQLIFQDNTPLGNFVACAQLTGFYEVKDNLPWPIN